MVWSAWGHDMAKHQCVVCGPCEGCSCHCHDPRPARDYDEAMGLWYDVDTAGNRLRLSDPQP